MSYKPQVWDAAENVKLINQARYEALESKLSQQQAQQKAAKQPFDWRRIAGVGFLSVGLILVFTLLFAGMGSINSPTSFWGAFWSVLPGMSAFAGSILVVVLGYVLVFDE